LLYSSFSNQILKFLMGCMCRLLGRTKHSYNTVLETVNSTDKIYCIWVSILSLLSVSSSLLGHNPVSQVGSSCHFKGHTHIQHQADSVTSQKTWIFSNITVRSSNHVIYDYEGNSVSYKSKLWPTFFN
jgi:hypothetical protein